ncbi:hypothetical protein BDV59DRAFT_211072 [Aspergillus ambiguus]|uniref:uncharacterized protein n=1 Tax=Aspergillus ambiguus TaxID=176160 RepID=UPI003CCD08CF
MRNPPTEVLESWPKPNYDNPVYQGPQLLIVGIILLVLSIIVVTLRIWVRLYLKNTAGWDDWLMVIAVPEWAKSSLMTSWFNQLLLVIIMALVKLSLLVSYLRFFTKPRYRRLTWAMIVFIVLWALAFIITLFLECRPLKDYWETIKYTPETCINQDASTFSFSITNLVTDLMVLVLPMRVLWMLKLPMRERLVLITLMSVGILACTASAVRVYYSYRTLNITYDITWDGYDIWLWILVEVNLAVMCASIPTLRPLLKKFLPRLGSRGSRKALRLV